MLFEREFYYYFYILGAWIFEEDYAASDEVVDCDTRIKAADFPAK